jgi:short-subunit dehydrogenase
MVKAVLPTMRKQRRGKIINIGSFAGFLPVPFNGYYTASKFALEGLSEALRQELKSLGVSVSIIEPGFFKTNILNATKETTNKIQDYDGMRERVYAAMRKRVEEGENPILVAKLVMKIIETEKPKLHYPVGKGKYILTLRKILPESTFENQLRKNLNVDG